MPASLCVAVRGVRVRVSLFRGIVFPLFCRGRYVQRGVARPVIPGFTGGGMPVFDVDPVFRMGVGRR